MGSLGSGFFVERKLRFRCFKSWGLEKRDSVSEKKPRQGLVQTSRLSRVVWRFGGPVLFGEMHTMAYSRHDGIESTNSTCRSPKAADPESESSPGRSRGASSTARSHLEGIRWNLRCGTMRQNRPLQSDTYCIGKALEGLRPHLAWRRDISVLYTSMHTSIQT